MLFKVKDPTQYYNESFRPLVSKPSIFTLYQTLFINILI
jgi:hypothetical protein